MAATLVRLVPLLVLCAAPRFALAADQDAALCYYPNGSLASSDTPCDITVDGKSTHATCCGNGYACMSNNMCKATGQESLSAGATVYVRGSCTDKDWDSSDCPQFCVNPNDPYNDFMSGGNGIGMCSSSGGSGSMFYCIDSADVDCSAGVNVLVYDEAPTAVTTIGYTPTTTPSPSKATESSSDSSSTGTSDSASTGAPSSDNKESAPSDSSSSKSSSNDTVAIAVGVSVGVVGLLAASITAFFLLRRRRASNSSSSPSTRPPPSSSCDSFHVNALEESYKGYGSANATEHIAGLEVDYGQHRNMAPSQHVSPVTTTNSWAPPPGHVSGVAYSPDQVGLGAFRSSSPQSVRLVQQHVQQHVQQPIHPVQQPIYPVQQPIHQVQQPIHPVQQPIHPVQQQIHQHQVHQTPALPYSAVSQSGEWHELTSTQSPQSPQSHRKAELM